MTITLDVRDVSNGGPNWVKDQMLKSGTKPYPYTWRGKGTSIEITGEPIENEDNNQKRQTAPACA
jgi:hypothetical protein